MNYQYKVLGALMILFFPIFLSAQDTLITLEGRILNIRDSSAIAYAHISIPTLGIGLVSNEIGDFKFNFPTNLIEDTIYIQHLGFELNTIPIKDLIQSNRETTYRIYLVPGAFTMKEVVIRANLADSARQILRKAIEKLKENYPSDLYKMSAFYREKNFQKSSSKFTSLMEAMIDIQDQASKTNPNRIKVKLNEFRKSKDYTGGPMFSKDIFKEIGISNNLYAVLNLNPARTYLFHKRKNEDGRPYPGKGNTFPLKWDQAEIKGLTNLGNNEVYYLQFKMYGNVYDIYVDTKDFGIYKIEIRNSIPADLLNKEEVKEKRMAESSLLEDEMGYYLTKVRLDYQKIDGIYYPSYIKWVKPSHYRNATKHFNYLMVELMVNDLYLNKKNIKKIKRRQQVKRSSVLPFTKMKYNQPFWEQYNVLLNTPLEDKVIKDLEVEKSLERQFEENSKANKKRKR